MSVEPARKDQVVVLVLEVQRDSNPPSGRIGPVGAQLRPFHGWTGLASALETALRDGSLRTKGM
jgi:hypothetical protein